MASVRDVVAAYRPELVLEKPVEFEEAVAYLAEKSGLPSEQIQQTLEALPELAFWFLVRGRPLALPGVGSLRPTIALDGAFGLEAEIDPELRRRMGEPEAYRAGIKRRENIGVPIGRLVQMWNSSHPDDRVQDFDPYAVPAAKTA
jgi:hypothetical protein